MTRVVFIAIASYIWVWPTSAADEHDRFNDRTFSLQIFDTIGEEGYDRLRPLAYPNSHAFVIAFSVINPESAENVYSKWIPEIYHHAPDSPIVIVGLQTDMRDDIVVLKSLAKQEMAPVTAGAGRRMAKQLKGMKYVECSSFTGEGVRAAFEEVRFIPGPIDSGDIGTNIQCI
ncbi:MAG: Rho GTPase [Candelina submexicana]|nr:MAG: Rho GTPase [Candelina submexicana]